MDSRAVALAQSLVVAAWLAVPPQAQDDEALKKDLTAVIALHGLPCGQVVGVTVLADSHYAATCRARNGFDAIEIDATEGDGACSIRHLVLGP